MSQHSMLTTIDNPFSPFDQYDEWYAYDEQMGHHSCSLLAHVARTSDELSQEDEDLAIQMAIDEIIKENVSGIHKKVTRKDEET